MMTLQKVKQIKDLGEILVDFNFPKTHPNVEDLIHPLKMGSLCVDGYDVGIHYSKADYDRFYLETLQVFGIYSPFVPFSLICKIGCMFLGNKYLSFIEISKEGKRVYCWTLNSDKSGNPIPDPNDIKLCTYEGFNYGRIDPQQVKFL